MKTLFTRLTSAASLALLSMFLTLGVASRGVADALIVVSSTCSLAQAIWSANFDSNLGVEGCSPGSGDDTILLPAGGVLRFTKAFDDAYSPFGPAAVPIIFSNITIEGNGARLEAAPPEGVTFRAFSVGEAEVPGSDGTVRTGTGNLHIKRLHIKNFAAKGGDGLCGGGGGMGAGGAVYAGPDSTLTIEKSTLEYNGAIGGNAFYRCAATGVAHMGPRGGGGGMGGNGGLPAATDATGRAGAGGGGGGSRGNGGDAHLDRGGAGGGTLSRGSGTGLGSGGFRCGADGTDPITWGDDGQCPGGGGAGGGQPRFLVNVEGGRGGSGAYGGGGGGAGSTGTPVAFINDAYYGEDGGGGGFGGGGGACAGHGGTLSTTVGGSSVFGGGGGACDEDTPEGFFFGGGGGTATGGSGAGLGGGVFSHAATVNIINSTLTGNYAVRGIVEGDGAHGTDLGGAVFAFQGSLTILNSTIAGNENTGSFGGVIYLNLNLDIISTPDPGFFTLRNTIIAHNGVEFSAPAECAIAGGNITVEGSGNLILQNTTGEEACPGVVSTTDPELLPLRLNVPGVTPTMAILETSSAADTADPATSLSSDQRGVDRPNLDGYDIGAYEARLPHFVVEFESISMDLGSTVTAPVTVRSADNFMDPVTLEADAGTTGLELSFDKGTVTPLPDQSASAVLTVRAGPTVVAGSHPVTLIFRSGALIRRAVTSVTVRATTDGMARTIAAFRDLGQIANAGVATALTSKLSVTQELINGGETQAAVNTLGALRFQINALSGKQIWTSAASVLLANTDALIATVGPTLTPSPLVGTAINAAGSPVANATIEILDATKSKIASANTDATGFYYVARTNQWTSGNTYTATIALPKGYKRATPSIHAFAWSKSLIRLPAFVLSK